MNPTPVPARWREPLHARRCLCFALALCAAPACGDKDSDSGAAAVAPDVAGSYNVIVSGSTGCEGDSSWIEDWAAGPLVIEDQDGGLVFDFGGEMVFMGGVDSSAAYSFSGSVDFNDAVLDVFNSGSFGTEDDRWVMSGDFEIEVDDDEFTSNNCTITGPIKAYQL